MFEVSSNVIQTVLFINVSLFVYLSVDNSLYDLGNGYNI